MLKQIQNIILPVRLDLEGSTKIRFGIEIEAEGQKILENFDRLSKPTYLIKKLDFSKNIGYDDNWVIKPDVTVPNGAEIHSPILSFADSRWDELKNICRFLLENGLRAGEHSALHVHLSSSDFMQDEYDLYKLLKLYTIYEKVLYLFGTGEYLNLRKQIIDRGALPMGHDVWRLVHNLNYGQLTNEKLLSLIDFSYFRGLRLTNLKEEKMTIEFRMANSSLNVPIIQNIINVYSHMFAYVMSSNYDDDFITRKFREFSSTKNFDICDLDVPLDELWEFADLIFDKQIDKLYFLRQCIKEKPLENKGLQKAKKFY